MISQKISGPVRALDASGCAASGIYPLFTAYLDVPGIERAVVAGLNSRGCLIDFQEVAGGFHHIDTILPPFRSILADPAVVEIVVAHSHPGLPATASEQDRLTTNRLSALARLAGAMLLDHLIFGADGIYSIGDGRLISASAH